MKSSNAYRFLTLVALMLLSITAHADIAYSDKHVRITVIDAGTLRLEYAPDGKFVDKKSFLAVIRDNTYSNYRVRETSKNVTLETEKLKLLSRGRLGRSKKATSRAPIELWTDTMESS